MDAGVGNTMKFKIEADTEYYYESGNVYLIEYSKGRLLINFNKHFRLLMGSDGIDITIGTTTLEIRL